MGTRNLTCVVKDGKYKIAQYGQYGGHPAENGLKILSFLRNVNIEIFAEQVQKVRFLSQQEYAEIINNYTNNGFIYSKSKHEQYWEEHLQHIDRDTGAEILEYVMNTLSPSPLKNSINFAGDSVFCEWCYVIDLDCRKFEIYKGFNKEELNEHERFYGYKTESNEYKPVKLKALFDIDNLPDDKLFIDTLL